MWVPICLYCSNCTKFGQLILRKIIKIVATRCKILSLKCTKFAFGWGSAPDPAGGAYRLDFGGLLLRGGGEEGRGEKGEKEVREGGGEEEGRRGKGRGREGKEKGLSLPKVNFLVTSLVILAFLIFFLF